MMAFSFNNAKMRPLRAVLALLIAQRHLAYFVDNPLLEAMKVVAPPSVAIFLFISGYGLTRSFMTKGDHYLKGFIPAKLLRIVLPALLVILLHILLCPHGELSVLTRLLKVFTHGNTLLPHYWFVWAILFDYTVFYLSKRFLSDRAADYVILGCTVLFLLTTMAAGFDRCWWICSLAFPTGLFYARHEESIYAFIMARRWHFALILFLLLMLAGVFYAMPSLLLRSVCYIFIPLIVSLCVARIPLDRWHLPILNFLGMISYEIYLAHFTVMAFLRGEMINIASTPVYIIAVVALTLLSAWLIHLFCSWLSKRIL